MKNVKWILIALLSLVSIASQAQQIVGYAPYYRTYSSSFDFSKYTHIHFFAIWPKADGTFDFPQTEDSLSFKTKYDNIASQVQSKGVKMIMTFGGTAENGSIHFEALSSNETTRKFFINQIISLCKEWNIDGVDIDWEGLKGDVAKKGHFDLLTDLRKACDDNNLSLSVDVAPSSWNAQHYDADGVKLADYVNVMSYSYSGSWSKGTDHHSNMQRVKDLGLKYWTDNGIPKSKLNLGVSFYGQKYLGTSDKGGAFTSMQAITFGQVQNLINNGYTVVEDDLAGTYCYSTVNNDIVFYDSPQNVAYKMNYAKDNGYSGVIIWEVGQDDASQTLSTSIFNQTNNITSGTENIQKKVNFTLQNKQLEIHSIETTSTTVYDIMGRVILTSSRKYIDLNSLSDNTYILVIKGTTEITRQKVFIF